MITNALVVHSLDHTPIIDDFQPLKKFLRVSRTSVGMTPTTVFFFLFGAVPDVGTVMPSRHVRQSDVNMIDKWTSAGQLAR